MLFVVSDIVMFLLCLCFFVCVSTLGLPLNLIVVHRNTVTIKLIQFNSIQFYECILTVLLCLSLVLYCEALCDFLSVKGALEINFCFACLVD